MAIRLRSRLVTGPPMIAVRAMERDPDFFLSFLSTQHLRACSDHPENYLRKADPMGRMSNFVDT